MSLIKSVGGVVGVVGAVYLGGQLFEKIVPRNEAYKTRSGSVADERDRRLAGRFIFHSPSFVLL